MVNAHDDIPHDDGYDDAPHDDDHAETSVHTDVDFDTKIFTSSLALRYSSPIRIFLVLPPTR
jgi:hypothetical protein